MTKLPMFLLVLAGSGVAWASELPGSNARILIPLLGLILVASVLRRQKPFPAATAGPWILLIATFVIPFLPGVPGAYPPTRFLLIIASALMLVRTFHWVPERPNARTLFLLLLWITFLAARSHEVYKRLGYGYDLAHILNILSNTLEGRFLWSDYTGGSILSHHLFLTLTFLAPLHGLWKSPFLLQGIQIILMGASVILIQQAVYRLFGKAASAAAFFAFLLHPAFQGQALHEFDPGVIGLFGASIALLGYAIPHRATLLAGVAVAMLSKELFIIAALIGGVLLLRKTAHRPDAKRIIGGALLALALFLGLAFIFGGPLDLATQIRIRFSAGAGSAPPIFSFGKIGYLIHMLVPSGGLALIAWPFLLPALPEILLNLLSRFPMYHLAGHYSVVTLPFLAMATGTAVAKVESRFGSKNGRRAAVYIILCALLSAVFSNLGPISHTGAFYDVLLEERSDTPRMLDSLMARLPDGTVAVRGNHRLLVYLENRRPVIQLPYIDMSDEMESRDLLICDNAPPPDPTRWTRIDSQGEVVVYARKSAGNGAQ